MRLLIGWDQSDDLDRMSRAIRWGEDWSDRLRSFGWNQSDENQRLPQKSTRISGTVSSSTVQFYNHWKPGGTALTIQWKTVGRHGASGSDELERWCSSWWQPTSSGFWLSFSTPRSAYPPNTIQGLPRNPSTLPFLNNRRCYLREEFPTLILVPSLAWRTWTNSLPQ